jgi:hypothetical protein
MPVKGILERFRYFSKILEVIRILSRLPGVGYTGESIRQSQVRKMFNTRIPSQLSVLTLTIYFFKELSL